MRSKLFVSPVLAVGLFFAAVPAFSQTAPAYTGRTLNLSIGVGPSNYNVDWGHGRMNGGAIWVDWYPHWVPSMLHGLGMEVEARDISLNRHLPSQKNIRQDTLTGGPIYTWRHFHDIHPYGKFLIGQGSYDFTSVSPYYSHDTRMLLAPGGGFEYRFYRQLWARADYEYQIWQTLLKKTPDPQGFTVGVAYDFSHPWKR